jgi:hypothetical protein
VQAAEVVVANICKRTPRWGVKTGAVLLRTEPKLVQYSELAGGLATLELHAEASLKHVRKLMRISLRAPTENALAQAIWARRQVALDFNVNEYLTKIPNAYEASARAAFETEDYQGSSEECWRWLEDETFSARAALFGGFVSFCLLGQYDDALAFAEIGLRANPNEPMLWNNKILALAYLGRAEQASAALPHLEAFQSDRKLQPFVFAARGLVAFRLGNFAGGRQWYLRTLETCREAHNESLAANASIYLARTRIVCRNNNCRNGGHNLR